VLEKKASPMSMVGFPLLLIPLAIYNIIAFLMPGVTLAEPLLTLTLMSGVPWPVTLSDILLALGILLLLLEVMKGARPGGKYLTDHLLSLIVFGAAGAEFLLWPKFGTSTFFLLTLLSLVDFLSGIALRSRRVTVADARSASRKRTNAAPEPQIDPAAVPSGPAAVPAAAAAAQDRVEPRVVPAEVQPAASSPEVASPELQPREGSPPAPEAPLR
jgi:hypothetical protein